MRPHDATEFSVILTKLEVPQTTESYLTRLVVRTKILLLKLVTTCSPGTKTIFIVIHPFLALTEAVIEIKIPAASCGVFVGIRTGNYY